MVQVEVCEADLDGLITRGLLDRLHRDNLWAVQRALHALLDKL